MEELLLRQYCAFHLSKYINGLQNDYYRARRLLIYYLLTRDNSVIKSIL